MELQIGGLKVDAEGSRGGHVIGHTSTGKPIYAKANHPSHAGFSSKDHTEAMNLHKEHASKANAMLSSSMHKRGVGDPGAGDLAIHHSAQANAHRRAAQKTK